MIGLMALSILLSATPESMAQGGTRVIVEDALIKVPVGGLERTNGSREIVDVEGQPFKKAIRVTLRKKAAETNATQMTILNDQPVSKGDVLIATVWIKGRTGANKPARVEFLFEKSLDPWTKSIWYPLVATAEPSAWKRYFIPFVCADTYGIGQVMASLRFATDIQQVEVGGLEVINYGKSKSFEEIQVYALSENKLGSATITLNLKKPAQRMMGMGGNFCQPRYGRTQALDNNGRYCLDNLKVVHARIGVPLNYWNPILGVYKDEAQAKASFLALQEMKKRKIPTVVSVWVGPEWMVGPDRMGMTLKPKMVDPCIESIAEYLKTARDKYGVEPEYFSFNEPDYGVNFKFTPASFIDFIKRAGAKFQSIGIKTKFLVGDTANGANFKALAVPLLEDKSIAPYLGPIAFHCWDSMGAPEDVYRGIAEIGKRYHKPVWCLEAGHDAALWEKPNPWSSWDNALNTAIAYARTVRLTEASLMDYWTYQDNYPLIEEETGKPRMVFHVMKQMEAVLGAGRTVVQTDCSSDDVQHIATIKGTGIAVMIANPIGSGTMTLKGLPAKAKFRAIVSDKHAQGREAKVVATDARGTVTVALPERSVLTLLSQP